ncbi:hypothetical protein CA606_01550 [Caulobacter vibrioides]|uniref:Uncharacterized protein n=1 Tax=Caulobacter vibrioides TaxID=155892 RepID=A0A290MGH4_CAUVI|nr:hypothetical protein [Caulobacter vibrioides]ATC31136.1 hypothetical protein CA606_01550 [Caulobacter vibrioides]
MPSLDDLTLDNMLDPRIATGRRGRPRGSGKRDGQALWNVCNVLAANPDMTVADAIRTVVTDPKDYNAVDRISRKLARLPSMRQRAVEYYEAKVMRVLKGGATSHFMYVGVRDRREFDQHFRATFFLEYDVLDDKRVKAYADRLWSQVRSSSIAIQAMEVARRIEDAIPAAIRNALTKQEAATASSIYEREMARVIEQATRYEKLYRGAFGYSS